MQGVLQLRNRTSIYLAPQIHTLAPQENGADSLAEIKETSSEKDLVEALQLLPVKAKLVLGRIAKWQPPQPLDEAQLSAKKVPELKELCQKRGLSDQGKKAELVARLLE